MSVSLPRESASMTDGGGGVKEMTDAPVGGRKGVVYEVVGSQPPKRCPPLRQLDGRGVVASRCTYARPP